LDPDLIDLQDATANGNCEALRSGMLIRIHGLTDVILSQFWLGLGADEASVKRWLQLRFEHDSSTIRYAHKQRISVGWCECRLSLVGIK
jgi:hypothetical protein